MQSGLADLAAWRMRVQHRSTALREKLKVYGDVTIETDRRRTTSGWAWVRDVEAFHGLDGDVWRISVKPTDAPNVVERLGARGILLDWSGGLIWALTDLGQDVRAALAPVQGHATLVRSEQPVHPRFHPESEPVAAISRGLREKFDPRGILNAGLMG